LWPQLYVLDEIRSQSATVVVDGTYTCSVYTPSETLLASIPPGSAVPLAGTPITAASVDMLSDPGHIMFTYENQSDAVVTNVNGGITTAYMETKSDTTHIVHVFTPSYFLAHFTDPTQIVLSFTSSANLSASATLPAGALNSSDCEAAGSISDAFKNYPVGN
jgi:hypothetical protein